MVSRTIRSCRSEESIVRIWNLTSTSSSSGGNGKSILLCHDKTKEEKKNKISALDWNGDGSMLACGSTDGLVKIWSKEGAAHHVLLIV